MKAGLVGEWASPDQLLIAVQRMRANGYTRLDAHTPFAVSGLEAALGLRRSQLTWVVFPIALGAAFLGYFIQWYCNAYAYPIDVGGRPAHAPPAFVPITFETMVLASSVFALIVFFYLARLPWLSHPIFEVDGFERASIDRFFLAVDVGDPRFEAQRTARELADAGALRVQPFGGEKP
jgi:Alternative complex III, ActD subunit